MVIAAILHASGIKAVGVWRREILLIILKP